MSGQHVFSSAVGLQGFCGVDILRQLRLAPHHRPLFPLLVLQLRGETEEGGSIMFPAAKQMVLKHVFYLFFNCAGKTQTRHRALKQSHGGKNIQTNDLN